MVESGSFLSSWLGRGQPRVLLRWLAVVVASALVVTVAEASQSTTATATAAATADVVSPQAAPGQVAETGLSAPDEASARLTARLRGQRVEVLDARTEFDSTYAEPDGSLTWTRSTGQVRFRRGEAWVPVDLELARAADGSVAPKAHPHGLRLSGGGGAAGRTQDLAVAVKGDATVALGWRGALPTPVLSGARATYPAVSPGVDLVVEATRTGFEQFLVIESAEAALASVSLPLRTTGATARAAADGGVELVDGGGTVVGTVPAPVMWDASGDAVTGAGSRHARVGLAVKAGDAGQELVLTPDAALLKDPATRFPVTVDPSVTLGPTFDTWVQENVTAPQYASTYLAIGRPASSQRLSRSFLTFDTSPIKGTVVTSAWLYLYNFSAPKCGDYGWSVWTANPATTASIWTNEPNVSGWGTRGPSIPEARRAAPRTGWERISAGS